MNAILVVLLATLGIASAHIFGFGACPDVKPKRKFEIRKVSKTGEIMKLNLNVFSAVCFLNILFIASNVFFHKLSSGETILKFKTFSLN